MHCCVSVPVEMENWPSLLPLGRIVGFDAEIKAQKEIIEVHAQAKPVGACYLFPEGVEVEHASWLIFVTVDGPYVASINECAPLKHPE